jgi:hypothetical protein
MRSIIVSNASPIRAQYTHPFAASAKTTRFSAGVSKK